MESTAAASVNYLLGSGNTSSGWLEPIDVADASIEIWSAQLDTGLIPIKRCWPLLSPDERERALRYRLDTDRRSFVVARATLRALIAARLDEDPVTLKFIYTRYGKPQLAGEKKLSVNVSRAHQRALVAISRKYQVGVDVEYAERIGDFEGLINHFFSRDEARSIESLDTARRRVAFLTAWTRKEAIAKAHGCGLSMPFAQLEVPWQRMSSPCDAARWSLYDLPVAGDYIASAAVLRDNFE